MHHSWIVMMIVGAAVVALPAGAQMRGAPVVPLNAEGGFAERHRSAELPSVVVGMQASARSWAAPEPFSWCGAICIVPERSTWRVDPAWHLGRLRRPAVPIVIHRRR